MKPSAGFLKGQTKLIIIIKKLQLNSLRRKERILPKNKVRHQREEQKPMPKKYQKKKNYKKTPLTVICQQIVQSIRNGHISRSIQPANNKKKSRRNKQNRPITRNDTESLIKYTLQEKVQAWMVSPGNSTKYIKKNLY